ncbi:glycolate oxidase subunit GlcE [Xanthobacter sp. V4C-4]|uniref:glycolate oxidase subunit GlcE n=1 Tax=Xanthobacter cornucopiae TaxID=3119924 RepID=UPI0037264D8B
MSEPLAARDEQEVADIVAAACAARRTLEIVGAGSRRGLGRPAVADAVLSVGALCGVTLYEPEELVLSARCGTPRRDIEALLAEHGQMLAFEPMDTAPLLGGPAPGEAGGGTLGGLLAVNLSGPRRLSAGAARDHVLGMRAVSGRGEAFKAGGRVVKNVTGYDLPRLNAGAFGTLGVLTEITLKVLPRPETEETLVVPGVAAERAGAALAAAMGAPCEVSGAAYVPAPVAARLPSLPAGDAVLLRLEGVRPSVLARRALLLQALAPFGAGPVLEAGASAPLWREVRDARPFAAPRHAVVWRLSTAPMAGPPLAAQLARTLGGEAYCDWAGGLIWLALPGEAARAEAVRAALAPHGGHATLLRASVAERAAAPVFQPLPPALAALTRRVKASFDPAGVLNPGRMHADI